jgi:phosphate transport system substrate-binding protein
MHRPIARSLVLFLSSAIALVSASAHAQSRDHISIAGSSTVFPFSSAVAEAFGKAGHFKTPIVESTGTGGGFKVFCSGVGPTTTDVNDASRPITDSEKETCAKNGVTAIDEVRVGYDGIILAGIASAKSFDVSLEQLWLATAKLVPVAGKWVANPYKRWSDINPKLPNKTILLYGPAPNHGTRDAFVELVMDPSCQHVPEYAALAKDEQKKTCQTVREDGAWIDVSEDYALIMGKLAGDANAMAVFTFSYLDQNRNKIKASTVNGVAASLETISSGKYPISRPLFIYVKRAHVGLIPGLAEFAQEYVSARAAGKDGYLADKGLIPMPAKELSAQQAIAKSLRAAH